MALIYIIGCLIILFMKPKRSRNCIPRYFCGSICTESCSWRRFGVTVQKAMRFGVARGLFSNEAGMGSTPHAHATADVKHPGEQGVIAMMGVFIDTFVILTLTALVILSTGALSSGKTGSRVGTDCV